MPTFRARASTVAAAALMLTGGSLIAARPAQATGAYAGQTKLPCTRCHTTPSGTGPLTPFGQKFKDNGHQIKP